MTELHHTNESMYLAHQLVPADDMAFALWRKPTFHFVNVKPMHRKLIPLWDHICDMIRLHAKKVSLKKICDDKSYQYFHFILAHFNPTPP